MLFTTHQHQCLNAMPIVFVAFIPFLISCVRCYKISLSLSHSPLVVQCKISLPPCRTLFCLLHLSSLPLCPSPWGLHPSSRRNTRLRTLTPTPTLSPWDFISPSSPTQETPPSLSLLAPSPLSTMTNSSFLYEIIKIIKTIWKNKNRRHLMRKYIKKFFFKKIILYK